MRCADAGPVRAGRRLAPALEPLFGVGEAAELHVTETETGFDCAFRWRAGLTPALTADTVLGAVGSWHRAADHGPRDLVFETAAAGRAPWAGSTVALPPNPFLQSTAEGEAALQARVLEIVGKAKTVADLFAGCGTFALPLARKAKVHAVEQDEPALAALAAGRQGAEASSPSPPRPATCSSCR